MGFQDFDELTSFVFRNVLMFDHDFAVSMIFNFLSLRFHANLIQSPFGLLEFRRTKTWIFLNEVFAFIVSWTGQVEQSFGFLFRFDVLIPHALQFMLHALYSILVELAKTRFISALPISCPKSFILKLFVLFYTHLA